MWEGTGFHLDLHKVDGPEALPAPERGSGGLHEHEDDWLADTEGQDRSQQAAAEKLLLAVIAAARARDTPLTHLQQAVHTL
jgi:hypothetical protein